MSASPEPTSLTARSADGHHWRMPRWDAPGDHATLYWIPALGVPAAKYQTWAEALRSRGIGVVVHEWRGIASSSVRAARGSDWNYRTLLEQDLDAGLSCAQSALPGRRWLIGGHSLGGQFAALALAAATHQAEGLVLVATGVPHTRTFRAPMRWLISGFARTIAPITALVGHFPGDRLRWAGREAGGVMRDWGRTVLTGRYGSVGLPGDPETSLAALRQPALAITFADDWLVPAASMDALLAKLASGEHRHERFDAERLGAEADHFRWMRRPAAVADLVAEWAKAQLR